MDWMFMEVIYNVHSYTYDNWPVLVVVVVTDCVQTLKLWVHLLGDIQLFGIFLYIYYY